MNTLASPKFEDAIIGTLIQIDEMRPVLMPKLSPEAFSQIDRRRAYELVQEMYEAGRTIDLMTVEDGLKQKYGWDESQINNILFLQATYSGEQDKVDTLIDRKTKRGIFDGLTKIIEQIKTEDRPASAFITDLENLIHDKVEDLQIPGLNYSQVLAREANKPKNQKLTMDDPFMQNTFFAETAFHKGEILVPFGDTGAGKTYWVVWLVTKLLESGHKGVFAIRESRAKKLFERFERGISNKKLLDNLIVADIEQGIGNLGDIVQTVKYHNAVSDIDFFVADHLKIIPVEGLNEWEETKRIQTCINRFIYLSQEVNALGIPLSQVNRETMKHATGWKRDPDLHNLFGSSAIEQAAHMAVSIFRPSNYEDLTLYDKHGTLEAVKGPNYANDPLDKHEPNSVFIRQKKVREGPLYRKYVKFLHTDKGMVRVKAKSDMPF